MDRTRDDLIQDLRDQLSLLRDAAAMFDSGAELSARWLSTCIRILVHDTSTSHSLLGQVDIKEELRYIDTADEPDPESSFRSPGLTMMILSTDGTSAYKPLLGDGPPTRSKPPLAFDRWWNTKVIKDQDSNLFGRRDLVLAVANTDGGAHVDTELGVAYASLSRSNSVGLFVSHGGSTRSLGDPVPASIRQIAYELELTVSTQAPALLGIDSL